MNITKNCFVITITLVTVLIACMPGCKRAAITESTLPFYNSPDFSPYWLTGKATVNGNITHTIAGYMFTNQDGMPVNTLAFKGKIHVADFFFTSCGSICPKMKDNFKKLQTAFLNDTDVFLVSYTVTPWIDSAARLKKYAERNGILSSKWQLLTGSQKDIYTLARRSYFAEEETGFNKDSSDFLHTEHFILVDKNLRIRGIYDGTLPLETERLMDDIHILQKESQ